MREALRDTKYSLVSIHEVNIAADFGVVDGIALSITMSVMRPSAIALNTHNLLFNQVAKCRQEVHRGQ